MASRSDCARRIEAALGATAIDVAGDGGAWRFTLAGLPAQNAAACISGDVLEIIASLPTDAAPRADAWSILCFNDSLCGPVRVGVDASKGLHLRADVDVVDGSLEGDEELSVRVARITQDVRDAYAAFARAAASPDPVVSRLTDSCASDNDAACLAREAGWRCEDREGGVEVTLDAADVSSRARLESSEEGRLRAVCTLAIADALTPVARAAVGLLLLRASAAVRAVKGVAFVPAGVQTVVGVASACEPPRSATSVDRMLSSLAVARRLVGREICALSDDGLAREYLAWHARGSAFAALPMAFVESGVCSAH